MELVHGDGYSFERKDINKEHLSIPFVKISTESTAMKNIFLFPLPSSKKFLIPEDRLPNSITRKLDKFERELVFNFFFRINAKIGGEGESGGVRVEKKSQADAINKSGKLLRARSEIHGIQSFRFTTFPRGAKQGL